MTKMVRPLDLCALDIVVYLKLIFVRYRVEIELNLIVQQRADLSILEFIFFHPFQNWLLIRIFRNADVELKIDFFVFFKFPNMTIHIINLFLADVNLRQNVD